jgi:hypothetical protein
MVPTIIPSEAERSVGILDSETIQHASRCFRKDGALIVEDILPVALIARARQAFGERYFQLCSEREDVARVGGRRFLVTLNLEPPFDDACFFANPYLLPILGAALDENFVVGAFGVVCALPAAPTQHIHNDGGDLFHRPDIDRLLPTVAITVAIPLLEMNVINGTTTLWLGSHRDRNRVLNEAGVDPVVREGSSILWDFRLKHSGTANRGPLPRPLLYLTYCRPWFLDNINFNKTNPNQSQKPLIASKDFLSGLPEQHQRLFARAQWD